MDIEVQMVENFLSRYKCSANSAVCFKLVRNENDVFDKGKEFHPTFTHQFFGDSETIFGYSGLEVQMYFHAGSLLTYIGLTFESEINGKVAEGIEADPVVDIIAEKLVPAGFLSNKDDFIAKLSSESSFRPMGELLHSYHRNDADYEIYYADIMVPKFKEYHSRLQTFLLWFIDAASYIDTDDERWHYYLMFEKKKVSGEVEYNIAGYMTVYHYYAYPDKIRPRISQMLILPPYQKQGLGAELLRIVNNQYIKDPNVLDITVEDPSDDFIRLRDYVDSLACSQLKCFDPDKLHFGFTNELSEQARVERKICKLQCRRVYEILRLRATDRSNVQKYREYRLDVKNRLNMPYQYTELEFLSEPCWNFNGPVAEYKILCFPKKEKSDIQKLQQVLSAEEMSATLSLQSQHERLQKLEQLYNETEEGYMKIIERLAAS